MTAYEILDFEAAAPTNRSLKARMIRERFHVSVPVYLMALHRVLDDDTITYRIDLVRRLRRQRHHLREIRELGDRAVGTPPPDRDQSTLL